MAHILISDDSASIRQMLEFTLSEAHHNVVKADNGLQALELAKTYPFDLVITDVNMPSLDGLSLVRELRALPVYQFRPILLLTTESDPEKKKIAKTAGATGWIMKPFDPDKLLAAVRKVLDL
ncbi:MAG: response regulator [Beggiatoa sp. IS2]|nr:MAG: response regulator [Beggiatoa sp. IS2]